MTPLSYNSIVGGSSSASNDFTISLGTSGNTRVPLSTEFPAGTYTVTSALSDSTLDIYLIGTDGTNAGYVNTSAASFSMTATKAFDAVVVLGATNNDTLSFVFQYVFSPNQNSTTDIDAAPATITSISPSGMPNVNNTTEITGRNFASNVTVHFVGTDNVSRAAKTIVRNSSTSLTVTRPDTLPELYSPYTLVVANPSIPVPSTTNQHRLSSAVTTKPSVPTVGTFTSTGTTTGTLTFTAPANNGGLTVTSYTATSSPGGLTFTLNQAGSGTFNISGLTAGTAYTFTVVANNANGSSTASSASNSATTFPIEQAINNTSTYTVPAGVNRIAAWVFGPGASGNAGTNNGSSGNGGYGGGLVGFKDLVVTPGQAFTVTVGTAGGTTSFGNIASVTQNGTSNVAGHVSQSGGAGGAGGVGNDSTNRVGAPGGSINTNLSLSVSGIPSYSASGGGGGGAKALTQHGEGGGGAAGTPRGGHGGGAARIAQPPIINAGAGGSGTAPGGGAGGGGGGLSGYNAAGGGTGGSGRVLVYEFRQ